jgi:glycosyltransferase involved in cell wall biosynthesis
VHVGLNLHYLNDRSGGAGTYARELVPALLAARDDLRLTCFVSSRAPAALVQADWDGRVRFVTLPGDPLGASPLRAAQSVYAQWLAEPVRAWRRRIDVVHGLANVAPLGGRAPTVVTLLDLTWLHVPDALSARAVRGMKVLGLTSARRADRVIAISQAGKDDIVETIGLSPRRIDVTLLGVSPRPVGAAGATAAADVRRDLDLGAGPVVLCVAQMRAHKNLAALIDALALIDDPALRLVLVGEANAHEQELRAQAGRLGVADRVRFPGWMERSDLDGLYDVSACCVLPSLMEGFGLPIAEAMSRGVPVACSDRSSLPEVAGGAALLFDPHEPAQIADAIRRIVGDPGLAADLVARGHRRVGELTWDATARATLASYERALA